MRIYLCTLFLVKSFAFVFGANTNPYIKQNLLNGPSAVTEVLNLASPAQLNRESVLISYDINADNNRKKDISLTGVKSAEALSKAFVFLSSAYNTTWNEASHGFGESVSAINSNLANIPMGAILFIRNQTVHSAAVKLAWLHTAGFAGKYSLVQLLNGNYFPLIFITNTGRRPESIRHDLVVTMGGFKAIGGTGDCFSFLKYYIVDLPAINMIGGIKTTNYLKDVRAYCYGNGNFAASIFDFALNGMVWPAFLTDLPKSGAWASHSYQNTGLRICYYSNAGCRKGWLINYLNNPLL